MKVECICGYLMNPERIKLHEHRQQDDLIDVYYTCPKCKAQHHACYHNAETKNLHKLIKKAERAGDTDKLMEYREKFKTALDSLNNRL